jgi:hypothetical protein
VDLFGEDGRWWLRHTRDAGTLLNRWKRGAINPNSLYTAAVASVWVNAPYEQWPGEPAPPRITEEQALDLAKGLRENLVLDKGTEQRGDWTGWMGLMDGTYRGQHAEEALVRHALPRFESAQQLIGLIVAAERRAPDGRVLARRRSALIWWRDPYPDAAGQGRGRILLRTELPPYDDLPDPF